MTRTPQQIGSSNRAKGNVWQLACAAWLRDNGWPNAAYEVRNGKGDIIGTGDISPECYNGKWDDIWAKIDQSRRDATNKGLDEFMVWKKRNGRSSPGEGMAMMPAKMFWALMADLAAYRRSDLNAETMFERGYELGRRERGTA